MNTHSLFKKLGLSWIMNIVMEMIARQQTLGCPLYFIILIYICVCMCVYICVMKWRRQTTIFISSRF